MTKFFSLSIILFSFIAQKGCDNKTVDTSNLVTISQSLANNIHTIDSFANLIGTEICPDLYNLDSLRFRYNEICFLLEKYDVQSKELLIVDSCIVSNKEVKFSNNEKAVWFKERKQTIDSIITLLHQDVKLYKRQLEKNCVKNYEVCQEIIGQNSNQNMLKAAKKLIEFSHLPEETLYQDSLRIKGLAQEYRQLTKELNTSPFYSAFLIALVEDINFLISHKKNKQYCNNAHIRWAALEKEYIDKTKPCEIRYLYTISEKWMIRIDSQWIMEQAEISRKCALKPRGCTYPTAINYDSLAVVDNETCVGCMDSLALNYCPIANRQNGDAPCEYAVCMDRCYAEKVTDVKALYPNYKANRDMLVHVDSLCINNLCGCTNTCATNYNPNATIAAIPDTCTGIICGCLDSSAVNYALRVGSDYYNDKITDHDSSVCHWKGCMSICALNYDPLARIDDGSCICDSVSLQDLEKMITAEELNGTGIPNSPEILEKEFREHIDQSAKKYTSVDFRRVGIDLVIDMNFRKMKIESEGELDNIPLGAYHFRPVDQLIDVLIIFLNNKTNKLAGSMLEVKIVGEADGHQISSGGLEFNNAGRSIQGEVFKKLSATDNTSLATVSDPNYDLTSNVQKISLVEQQKFTDNTTLAFLRAYMVKQKIKDAEPSVDEKKILIGAKANTAKGGQYRRIGVSMTLTGFFKLMAEMGEVNNEQIQSLEQAIDFYNINGYPTSNKTYTECPCYQRNVN